MKRADTKLAFAASFCEIASRKAVDRITVDEICAGAGRSPATFYRHFRDKYDLAVWDYARGVERIVGHIGEGRPWDQTLRDSTIYHWEHRDLLNNLIAHTSGRDSFMRHMARTSAALLMDAVAGALDPAEPSSDLLACVKVYSYGTIQLVCEWVAGEFESTPEQLVQIMESCLPEPLMQVLISNWE